ncbi:MAG: hypothetical protein WKF43_02385 [Acidimicrobiales bacterium]
MEAISPDVLVVDSIQSVHDPDLASAPGSVGQVRESAHRLVQTAKARGMATVLVGHVTKDGGLAGPRVLEHVVDTVLSFEGDRHHALRLLRAVKHRFGSTHELGLFEMTGLGLEPVADPSACFLADRRANIAGSVVVPIIDGFRPLLVEIQALIVKSNLPSPRRSAQGLDGGRLSLLLAVLDRRVGLEVRTCDVHTLAVGGIKVAEPGADLAVALALVSAAQDVPLPTDLVACGEIGLGASSARSASSNGAWPRRPVSGSPELSYRPRPRRFPPASTPSGPRPWSRQSRTVEPVDAVARHRRRECTERLHSPSRATTPLSAPASSAPLTVVLGPGTIWP